MIKEAKILLIDNVHNNLIDKFDLLSDFDPVENNAPQNFNFYPSIFKIPALFSLALIKLLPKTKSENLMQDLKIFSKVVCERSNIFVRYNKRRSICLFNEPVEVYSFKKT